MTSQSLIFDAVAEAFAAKMVCRWHRSWSAYETWFRARSGDSGPNITLADRHGATATVELLPDGAGSAQLIVEASL
jgi:hypothetical protein